MTYPVGGFAPQKAAVASRYLGTLPGVCSDAFPGVSNLNNSNRVANVWTLTVATFVGETDYSFSINGITYTVTSPATSGNATTDKNAVRDLIIDAVNGDTSILNGTVVAAANGTGIVTLTGLQAGVELDVVENDDNFTLVETTAASNSEPVPFGKIVCRTEDGTGFALPSAVAAVAQVSTLTFSAASNSSTYYVTIIMTSGTYAGIPYEGSFVTDGSATAQEIVEGIAADLEAALPPSTVAVTEDNTKLIFTAEVAGVGFNFTGNCSDPAVTVTKATTTANVEAALTLPVAGIVQYYTLQPDGKVPADKTATIIERCSQSFLKPENAPSAIDATIYLRHTTGSDAVNQTAGNIRFDDDDSGKCIELTGLKLNRTTAEIGTGTYSFRIPGALSVA